jgi:hypothetical protein
MAGHIRVERRTARLLVVFCVVLASLMSTTSFVSARERVYESFEVTGWEVFYAPDAATFVGTGGEASTKLSTWYATIGHTLSVIPTGRITGGSASLMKVDGDRVHGDFVDGFVRQTNPGPGCTTETHVVTGLLTNVTLSSAPAVTGIGLFDATLTHYRAWLFGDCYSYSASVRGTISIIV